jgi:hypothetical protein
MSQKSERNGYRSLAQVLASALRYWSLKGASGDGSVVLADGTSASKRGGSAEFHSAERYRGSTDKPREPTYESWWNL